MGAYIKKTYSQMVIDSYERAEEEYLIIEPLSDEEFMVMNIDHHSMYKVTCDGDYVRSCECAHNFYRNVPCKHMIKVANNTGKMVI